MTATDQAFIRVFDSQAAPRDSAPHVSFAARGVQAAAGFEPVIVWGGGATAESQPVRARSEVSPSAMQAPTAVAAPPAAAPKAAMRHDAVAPGTPGRAHGSDTYLPSAYRNLVDVEAPPQSPPQPQQQRSFRRHDTREGAPGPRTFAEPTRPRPPQRELVPAFEVDALHWPRVATLLLEQCSAELGTIADALELARERREPVTGFFSTHRGTGCTTLTLALARVLAGRGRSVAVVDADFLRPQLARTVGLAIAHGWETTLHSGTALAESVIRSLEDGFAVVPLAAALDEDLLSSGAFGRQVASAVQELAAHYDLVLVDGGCPAASAEWEEILSDVFAAAADGCVWITADATSEGDQRRLQMDERPAVLGVIENRAAGA